MASLVRIRMAVFSNGERMPLLVDGSGAPLFAPAVFITTQIRARNRAANTVEQVLRSIMVLYLHCRSIGIDIEDRVRTGKMLSIPEIDGLINAVRSPISELRTKVSPQSAASFRLVSIERVRARLQAEMLDRIGSETAATRLRYIHQYLDWMSLMQLAGLSRDPDYETAREVMLSALEARIPTGRSQSAREGLPTDAIVELTRIIAVDCTDNPWRKPAARYRNRLIVLMLYSLGLRAGELLSLKIDDISWKSNELTIIRRPDDPEDPRLRQPNVKTMGRILPIASGLAKEMHAYVLNVRSQARYAHLHAFFFIEIANGRPLSRSGLTKVFEGLSSASHLLSDLTPHVLRHTWNDRFSERADLTKMSEADEEKARSYLMGWKVGSGAARFYTRRHIRTAAHDALKNLQERLQGHAEIDEA